MNAYIADRQDEKANSLVVSTLLTFTIFSEFDIFELKTIKEQRHNIYRTKHLLLIYSRYL